jgi:hypothetical protein
MCRLGEHGARGPRAPRSAARTCGRNTPRHAWGAAQWDALNVVYDAGKIGVGYATGNAAMMAGGNADLAMAHGS